MSKSTIQWTDVTDNIFRVKGGGWWCRKISPGCVNCYAAKLNQSSFFGGNKLKYAGASPEMVLQMDIVNDWRRMTKPKRHFVASMTDIFGEWIHPTQAYEFLDGMLAAPKQTFQMLTKRPLYADTVIRGWLTFNNLSELPAHMWLGVSVENQEMADKRIPELLKIPAKVRFLSVEPMLGPIDFFNIGGKHFFDGPGAIRWAIFGGESGPGARPCNIEWIRSGVKQCQAAGVKVFVKQLGSRPVCDCSVATGSNSANCVEHFPQPIRDKKGGEQSEWPNDLRVREFPNT